jgi:SseB protein N-terminal domain/SseB protein C-terminal domain
MTIVTDDSTASVPGRGADVSAVERALAAAVLDVDRLGDLLDTLSWGRLWVPLPDDGQPVTDGSAVNLPTVTYLGRDFIPAYTSADQLRRSVHAPSPAAGAVARPAPPVIPHVVVPAAELARRLPGSLGIALNPGAGESVPVYPEGVAYVASARDREAGGRIRVSHPPAEPAGLLAGLRPALAGLPCVRDAATAWLSVEFAGEGLIISVTLDDPSDAAARESVVSTVERAATTSGTDPGMPIDVTFPGEGAPDAVDTWIAAHAVPFYRRT